MVNKNLFNTVSTKKTRGMRMSDELTLNNAGGIAYKMEDRAALAQLVLTGCFGNTFYVSSETQLLEVLSLTKSVGASKEGANFIAKLAVFARQKGHMKDMPAILMAIMAVRHPEMYLNVYDRVIDNAKMLRVHLEMLRSGQIDGKKTFPNVVRRRNKQWFNDRNPNKLFRDNVGSPSLGDLIKMLHPEPKDKQQEALFAYLCGKQPHEIKGKKFGATREDLPELVKQYENFKKDQSGEVPDLPFDMLSSLPLNDSHWKKIAKNAGWQMTRMNLNTFTRHNVLNEQKMINMVADRLANEEEIKKSRVFPYQLLAAYKNAENVSPRILGGLEQAMEYSTKNIPELEGNVYIFVDVSGSMGSLITGTRKGKKGTEVVPTKIRCIDAAALIAASIARRNPNAKVFCFDSRLHKTDKFSPEDSIFKITDYFASFHGGATDCSLGVKMLSDENKKVDVVIYISDYESWVDTDPNSRSYYGKTSTVNYWNKVKEKNPNAKMICIDLTPNKTIQNKDQDGSVINIGGFSDSMFDIMSQFVRYGDFSSNMVQYIEDDVVL